MEERAYVARVEVQTKEFWCPSWPTGKDVMTTSFMGQRSMTTTITTVVEQLPVYPHGGTALFRTVSPHQPPSGKRLHIIAKKSFYTQRKI